MKVSLDGEATVQVTTNRDRARGNDYLTLLGLEHPLVVRLMTDHRVLGASHRAVGGSSERWRRLSGLPDDLAR